MSADNEAFRCICKNTMVIDAVTPDDQGPHEPNEKHTLCESAHRQRD